MNLRIALAVMAAATILTLTAPAEARRATKAPPGATMPVFDAAAVPAYPSTSETAVAREKRASRWRGRVLTDPNGNPVEITHQGPSSGGIVRSAKTGATARVSPRYAGTFQSYIDDLESHGAVISYMGGIRAGRCSPASQHPCGMALDVCQDYRGHVSGARDCHLPEPAEMAKIASRHDLNEGSVWCGSPDYGHVQITKTGTTCAARGTFGPARVRTAKRHRHRLASSEGRRS